MPTAAEIPDFYVYDGYYTHSGAGHITPHKGKFFERVLLRFAHTFDQERKFLPAEAVQLLPPNATVCDLGCGNGWQLRRFKELGLECIGVDPDDQAIATSTGTGLTVLRGTAEDIPAELSDKQFDLVIMSHSMEHCRDPKAAIANAYKLTKPGGLCYVEVPNCSAEHFKRFNVCSNMYDAPRHLYFFTPNSLRRLIELNNFTFLGAHYHGFVRHYLPSWRDFEFDVARQVKAADKTVAVKFHDFKQSVILFLMSFWRKPDEKYDSFGWLVRRTA